MTPRPQPPMSGLPRVVNIYSCGHIYEADTRTYHEAVPAGVDFKTLLCVCPKCPHEPLRRLPQRDFDELP